MRTSEVRHQSFRLPHRDVEAWKAAAVKLGISQSEFLRRTLRGKVEEVLTSGGDVKVKSPRADAGGI